MSDYATLAPSPHQLLAYFEVDLDNAQGMTTLFLVNNAWASSVLTHVTVWTDLRVRVFEPSGSTRAERVTHGHPIGPNRG